MLQIDQLDVFRVRHPLVTPWRTAYGTESHVETLFVRSVGSSGTVAWIESCPLGSPLYLSETARSVLGVIQDHLAPEILGKPFAEPQDVFDHLSEFKGNSFAKAAIDLSFWAQLCLDQKKPLHQLLGAAAVPIPIGRGFGLTADSNILISRISDAISRGCKRAKLKVSPETDLEDLRSVRRAFPDLPMHVDCNGSFSPEEMDTVLELDTIGFQMIEQPFNAKAFPAHATLQKLIRTPVCLDESICDVCDARLALSMGACRAIALKPGRVGGLTPFIRILSLCKGKASCYVGGMLESGLGTSMNVELATLAGLDYVPDIPVSGQYFAEDLSKPGIFAEDGFVTPTAEPWVGQQVDEDVLERFVIERASIS